VCAIVLVFVVLPFTAVQAHQYLFRLRAQRLMADIHRIRLYQSSWNDAQRLMARWGAWGNYDGKCSAKDCRYEISMMNIPYPVGEWREELIKLHFFQIYGFLGGRGARVVASFTVHDGSIWRESLGMAVDTEKIGRWYAQDEFPLTLMIDTKSRQRLRRSDDDWWIMGDEDQLAVHPYYKEGRPGGCKINCEEAVVTYSTHTPPAEIERLSALNLNCLVRFSPCLQLEQLLPAAKEWHLYKEDEIDSQKANKDDAKTCSIPLWALARDSRYALAVKVMSATSRKESGVPLRTASDEEKAGPYSKFEESQVKVQEVLKGNPVWPLSSLVSTQAFAGKLGSRVQQLRTGRSYLVFPIGDDRRDQALNRESAISLDKCGLWDDTPQNRLALAEGFAQNDTLREPNPR
jgi:hypothetical protein